MSREAEIQEAYISWVRSQTLPYFDGIHSSLNGVRLRPNVAKKAKREGMLAGVADVFVPVASKHKNVWYHGLYLEFKTEKGELSSAQRRFRNYCHAFDYAYVIVRTTASAIDVTKRYLSFSPYVKVLEQLDQ